MYWFKNYNTGNKELDEKQYELIKTIYEFKLILCGDKDRADREVGRIIVFLVRYITEYFPLEEAYLKSIDFKDFDTHVNEHRNFIKKIYEVLNILKSKKSFRPIQLYYLLNEWMENHILVKDKAFLTTTSDLDKKINIVNEKQIVTMVVKGFQTLESLYLKEKINDKVREDKRLQHLRTVFSSLNKDKQSSYPIFKNSVIVLFDQGVIIDKEYKRINNYISQF